MRRKNKARRILWYECAGFLCIILMSWLDELLSLPQRLLGGESRSNWREAAMESIVTLCVWFVMFVFTRKIIGRLHYLEGMVKMCAWCRKLDQDGKWVPFEEYIVRDMRTKTSHGMCPECEAKMLDQISEEV
jgi:hypothetical protein